MKNYKNDEAKKTALTGLKLAIGLAAMAALSSGCGGMELGGKVGLYRVDEHQENTKMYRNTDPFICNIWPTPEKCPSMFPRQVEGS